MSTESKVAIVTGAGTGIGKAVALALLGAGYRVALAGRRAQPLHDAVAAAGAAAPRAMAVPTNVADPESVRLLFARTREAFGRLDLLFNNAGISVSGEMKDYTLADWDDVFDVNLRGVAYGVQAAYPIMIRQRFGHIVNTASMAGLVANGYLGSYVVTKHGVVALSESLYKELQVTGAPIGVSVVCPGLIDTNIMRSSRNRPEDLAEAGKAGPMAQAFGQALSDRLAGGYPPSEVADQVAAGIREGRFYIVPAQPEVKSGIAVRAQDLLELRNPTLRRA